MILWHLKSSMACLLLIYFLLNSAYTSKAELMGPDQLIGILNATLEKLSTTRPPFDYDKHSDSDKIAGELKMNENEPRRNETTKKPRKRRRLRKRRIRQRLNSTMQDLLNRLREKAYTRQKDSIHSIGHGTNRRMRDILHEIYKANITIKDTIRELEQESIATKLTTQMTQNTLNKMQQDDKVTVIQIDTTTVSLKSKIQRRIKNIAALIKKYNFSKSEEDSDSMTIYPTADNTPEDITIEPIDSNEHPMVDDWMEELHRDKYKKALKQHHKQIEQFKKEFKNKWKPLVGDLMQESGEEETRRKGNTEDKGKKTSKNKGRNERPINRNKSEIEGTTYRIKDHKKEITEHKKNLTKIINGTTRQFKERSKQMKHDRMDVQGEQKTSRIINKTKDHEKKKKKGPIDVSKEIREGMEESMKQDMYNWSEVLKEDEQRLENKGIYKWHEEHDGKLNHHWVMPDDFYDEPELEMTRERYIQKYGKNSIKEGTLTEEEEKELMDRIRRGEDINESKEHGGNHPGKVPADHKNDPEYIKKQMKIYENKLMGITESPDDIQNHGMLPNVNTVTTEHGRTSKREEIDLFKKHGIHLNEFWKEPGFNDNIAVVKETSKEMIFCDSDEEEDDITATGNRTDMSKQKKQKEKEGTHKRFKENGNCHSTKVKANGSTSRFISKRNNERIKKQAEEEKTTGGFKENKKKKFHSYKKDRNNITHRYRIENQVPLEEVR